MGNVVKLHAERWVEVFDENDLMVEVSTKGNIRFTVGHNGEIPGGCVESREISMRQMLQLGKMLSIAYGADEEELEERLRNVERDQDE